MFTFSTLKSLGIFVAGPVAPFKTDSFWNNENNGMAKLWFDKDFKKEILDNAPVEVSYHGERLERLSLTEEMLDSMIQNEAGGRSIMSIGEYLAWMKGMISLQPKGEEGILLTNGYGNIRYVAAKDGRTVAVYAYWNDGWWYFFCHGFDGHGQWGAGLLVFFPAIAEAAAV